MRPRGGDTANILLPPSYPSLVGAQGMAKDQSLLREHIEKLGRPEHFTVWGNGWASQEPEGTLCPRSRGL